MESGRRRPHAVEPSDEAEVGGVSTVSEDSDSDTDLEFPSDPAAYEQDSDIEAALDDDLDWEDALK